MASRKSRPEKKGKAAAKKAPSKPAPAGKPLPERKAMRPATPAKAGKPPAAAAQASAPAKLPKPQSPAPAPEPSRKDDLRPAELPTLGEIPWGYADNRVTLMARDPHVLFAYWEITDEGIAEARRKLGDPGAGCALRIYDTTGKLFNGLNPNSSWDVGVDRHTTRYYLQVGRPGATFHVDIGVRSGSGAFVPIARSGAAELPRDSVSGDTSARWSTVLRSGPGYAYRNRHVPKPPAPPVPTEPGSGPAGPVYWAPELEQIFGALAGEGFSRSEWSESIMDGRMVRWIRWTGPIDFDRMPISVAERLAAEGTYQRVEVLFQGERRTVRTESGERFVFGPWRILLEAVGPRGERRSIEQWMLRRSWTTEEVHVRVDTPAVLTSILGGSRATRLQGASESRMSAQAWGSERVQMGASEWRWRGASELVLGGASEIQLVGGSEKFFLGATEIQARGGSEQLWLGASERPPAGRGELWWQASSEILQPGASEQRP